MEMPDGQLMALNSILFEQLERLTSPDASNEDLKTEIERTKAVSNIARDVIANSNTIIHAAVMAMGNKEGSGWKAVRTLSGPAAVPAVTSDAEAKRLEAALDDRPF